MKLLSLFSGIEAASVAAEPLGIPPVAFSEIEPFPCAVLKHRWPDVPNLGDATRFRDWPDEIFAEADIIIGGSPCQAFSTAVKRLSLADERGNLAITYANLLNHADEIRTRNNRPPAVCIWENVPGVLNTRDNAFGCFLGLLAGEDVPLEPPGERWSDAGFVSGPERTIAWRCLDAQYFGLAQRRKRVFVVASAGNFRPEQILFESEGVRRDSPPRRETGEASSNDVAGSLGARGVRSHTELDGHGAYVPCFWNGEQVTQTLDAVLHKGQTMPEKNRFPAVLAFNHQAGGSMDMAQCRDNLANTIQRHQEQAVAVSTGNGLLSESEIAVRRLTPIEAERLQGFPDNHTKITYRNKPATLCPDGPRFKAIGNSMAVPVIRWILSRIDGWKRVSLVSDCIVDSVSGEPEFCSVCGRPYESCDCPGPMQEEFRYVEIAGFLYAKHT